MVCIILFTALAATTGCRCGIEGTGDRIVGGTEVSPVSRITLYYCILSCIVFVYCHTYVVRMSVCQLVSLPCSK